MSSSSRGGRLCRLASRQPVGSSPPRVPPPDGCVPAGDPLTRGGTKRGAGRRRAAPAAPLPSPAGDGKPSARAGGKPGASYAHAAQGRLCEYLGLKIPLVLLSFPSLFFYFFLERRMNERALRGRGGRKLEILAPFFVVDCLVK